MEIKMGIKIKGGIKFNQVTKVKFQIMAKTSNILKIEVGVVAGEAEVAEAEVGVEDLDLHLPIIVGYVRKMDILILDVFLTHQDQI